MTADGWKSHRLRIRTMTALELGLPVGRMWRQPSGYEP
jgi:hypothetical protein